MRKSGKWFTPNPRTCGKSCMAHDAFVAEIDRSKIDADKALMARIMGSAMELLANTPSFVLQDMFDDESQPAYDAIRLLAVNELGRRDQQAYKRWFNAYCNAFADGDCDEENAPKITDYFKD